jgi:hypothetical protein
MRRMFLFMILISSLAIKAQTNLPLGFMGYTQPMGFGNGFHSFESASDKKWFLTTYSGISTSFNFFNGSYGTILAAPLGLQLNRRLNNNYYAFAGISAAPAYINFNNSFLSSDANKFYPNNGFFRPNSFGMYSRAELGLMYVNDAKTFSISGSIGVQSSSYPIYHYQQSRTARPNPVIPAKK